MSAEAPPSAPRPTPPSAEIVKYDRYIDTRIGHTRRTVWTVELASALVALAVGVLGFLLTVAVVEHWLLPGGFGGLGRSVLFVVLVVAAAYYAYLRIWPLCVRRINPVYAAHAIEEGSPSLKNSLVNLLLFRERRGQLTDAVYETLEEQAAQRLTRVPAEAAVDRTHLIHLGYVLVAVVAVAVLYRVVSPKDPLVTAERVLMPWADVVPASRVKIAAVEPGTTTIARGESLDISAEVYGLRDDDDVLLRYTTDDGQAVDRAIAMTSDDGGPRFTCRLPSESEPGGAVGVTQPLRYRVEAGDARSLQYRVNVVAAPMILVRSVDYDYPDYTGFADRSVDDLGDIRAIEGTRVTIHARANGPIDEAQVDLDADGRRDLQMTVDGSDAEASFVLALRSDRQTPQHTSYVLRFTNTEGRRNREPVKHPIDVLRDYAPEAELTEPAERTRDVRLDETVPIGVDARDPDFALSSVRLQGQAGGKTVFDVPLLAAEHQGRFVTRYRFTPSKHGLKAGDAIEYWAVAADNRTPEPNTATSERKVLRITSPDPANPPQQPNQPRRQQPDAGQPNDQQQDGRQGQRQEGPQGQQQPGQQDQQQDDPQRQQQQGAGEQEQQQSQPGEGQQGEGQTQGQPQPGGAQNEGQPQNGPGAAGGAGEQAQPAAEDRQDQPQEGQSSAGARGDRNQSSSQQEQAGGDNNRSDVPADAQPGQGSDGATPDAEPAPISSDGDNDAEAFDRIRRHLRENGELNDQQQPAQPATEKPARQPDQSPAPEGQHTQGEGPSGGGDQPDAGQAPPDSRPDTAPAEKWQQQPSADEPPGGEDQPPAGRGERRPDSPGDGGSEHLGEGAERGPPPTPRDGTGSTGQNQSADEGAGESSEQGAGNNSPDAGGDRATDRQTGQPGSQTPGQGSSQRDGTGQQPGAQPGADDAQRPGGNTQQEPFSRDAQRSADDAQPSADDAQPPAGDTQQKPFSRDAQRSADDAQSGADDAQRPGGNTQQEPFSRDAQRSADDTQPSADDAQHPGGNTQQEPFSRDAQRSADDAQPSADDAQRPGGDTQQEPFSRDAQRSADDAQRAPGEAPQPGDDNPNPAGRPADQSSDASGTPTGGGGQAGTGSAPPPSASGSAPEGDDANLDYARKQTDLVLEKLADQLNRKRVDRELLDQLGWSEEDLRRFVARWQQRMRAAQAETPTADPARRELDEALRSLGLRPGPLRQSDQPQDQMRDLREGYRGSVPLEYRERLRAYSEGVSRSRQAEE